MSTALFSSETRTAAQSEPRKYSSSELFGKGLQRLSYQVESRYVTRRFKNRLKSLGCFQPNYGPQDRVPIFIDRVERKFSQSVSNRTFKRNWLRTHGSLKGLKEQPRGCRQAKPVHVGTIHRSKGKFYPNPLLGNPGRKSSGQLRWACRLLRSSLLKVRGENRKRENPEGNGSGQSPTNPVGPILHRVKSLVSRRVVLTSRGTVGALGGQRFSNVGDLVDFSPSTGTIRYFHLDGDMPVLDRIEHYKVPDSSGSSEPGPLRKE